MAKLSMNKNPKQRENTGGPSRLDLMKRVKELEAGENRAPEMIRTVSPFRDLFPVKPEVLDGVREDMKQNGYDTTQPLIIWAERDVLIDGHTRLQAAREAGLEEVPVVTASLESENDAVAYAYGLQFRRRNLDDADRFAFLEGLTKGGANVGTLPGNGKTRERVASLLTVSTGTAQKYLTVLKNAPEDLKARVRAGDLTINQAAGKLRLAAPPEPEPEKDHPPETPANSENYEAAVEAAGPGGEDNDLEPNLGPEDDDVTVEDARDLVRRLERMTDDLEDLPRVDDIPPAVRSEYRERIVTLQNRAQALDTLKRGGSIDA